MAKLEDLEDDFSGALDTDIWKDSLGASTEDGLAIIPQHNSVPLYLGTGDDPGWDPFDSGIAFELVEVPTRGSFSFQIVTGQNQFVAVGFSRLVTSSPYTASMEAGGDAILFHPNFDALRWIYVECVDDGSNGTWRFWTMDSSESHWALMFNVPAQSAPSATSAVMWRTEGGFSNAGRMAIDNVNKAPFLPGEEPASQAFFSADIQNPSNTYSGGTKGPYSVIWENADDRIQKVPDPAGSDKSCLKFTVYDDDTNATSNPRAQLEAGTTGNLAIEEGDEVLIGWDVYLPSDFPTAVPKPSGADAFITLMNIYGPPFDGAESLSWGSYGGTFRLGLRGNGYNTGWNYIWSMSREVEEWHRFIWRVKVSSDPEVGFVEVYKFDPDVQEYIKQSNLRFDGTYGTDRWTGATLTPSDDEGPSDTRLLLYYGRGTYVQNPSDGPNPVVIYYGHHALGPTFESVRSEMVDWDGTPSDTAPPVTTITSAPPEFTNDDTPTIEFEANEAATFEGFINEVSQGTVTSPWTLSTLQDGEYTVVIQATDGASNVEVDPPSVTFTVDTQKPTTTIVGGPENGATINTGLPNYQVEADEDGCTFEVVVGDEEPAPMAPQWPPDPLADGTYSIKFRATDRAGNVGDFTDPVTLTVDTTGPTVSISGPSGDTASPVTFEFSANEPATFEVSLDGQTWEPSSGTWSQSLPLGAYTLYVRGIDQVGNVGDPTLRTFIIVTAPDAPDEPPFDPPEEPPVEPSTPQSFARVIRPSRPRFQRV